ncbi:MAG: PEP-CTERM sorting domain-containing protein [Phycisphaerae bacterium]|nr:PEP-CTERM sorting domain-containing protein [Phycisphaerae bacterium]
MVGPQVFIPEPTMLSLLAIGGFVMIRRRRK